MRFEKIINIVLSNEDGYVNNLNDYGGETYKGISRVGFPITNSYGKPIWTKIDLYKSRYGRIERNTFFEDKDLDDAVIKLYYDNFYKPLLIDNIIDDRLAAHVFDGSLGGNKSQQLFRNTFNASTQAQAITNANNDPNALQKYVEARKVFYKNRVRSDKSQEVFLKGWLNRVDKVSKLVGAPTYPNDSIKLDTNITSEINNIPNNTVRRKPKICSA